LRQVPEEIDRYTSTSKPYVLRVSVAALIKWGFDCSMLNWSMIAALAPVPATDDEQLPDSISAGTITSNSTSALKHLRDVGITLMSVSPSPVPVTTGNHHYG